jgi:hypothetical protein
MPTNFTRRTSQETCCCEIHSSLALGGSESPAHSALSVRQFLTKNGMTTASQSPYYPDLAPCEFFQFPRMKMDLKGKRFQNVEEMKEKTMEALKTITFQEFQNCFEQWKKSWDKCTDYQGQYFEGD